MSIAGCLLGNLNCTSPRGLAVDAVGGGAGSTCQPAKRQGWKSAQLRSAAGWGWAAAGVGVWLPQTDRQTDRHLLQGGEPAGCALMMSCLGSRALALLFLICVLLCLSGTAPPGASLAGPRKPFFERLRRLEEQVCPGVACGVPCLAAAWGRLGVSFPPVLRCWPGRWSSFPCGPWPPDSPLLTVSQTTGGDPDTPAGHC